MANYDKEVFDLGQVLGYLGRTINFENEPQAPEVLNTGLSYYHEYFKLTKKLKQTPAFTQDPAVKSYLDFQRLVAPTQINDIILFFRSLEEEPEKEKEKRKPVKEDSTVPPEIESLVEEYRQNQARLEEEEIKSSHQRTVAEQVKIALSHSKIRELAMANRREREAAGEKFRDANQTIVELGDPKSRQIETVLSSSKKAVGSLAYTYAGFSSLPIATQRQIINQAVDFNLAGVTDLDAAIQTASLQAGIKNISSAFVSEVAEEIDDIDRQYEVIEANLAKNESAIDDLKSKTTLSSLEQQQLNNLLKENSNLSASLDKSSTRFADFVDSQQERFASYVAENRDHLKMNPDLLEMSEAANKKVSEIQNNLFKNGIVGRTFSDLDKIAGLVTVIQKDIPGIHQYASYEGSQAAAIIGGNQGQVVLAYSRGITGSILRQAEKYAAANPNSATAKFLANHTKVFQAARRSIRQIENSQLGKDILQTVSKGNQIIRIVTNPVGALKQWAGQKAGEQFRKRLVEKIGNVAIKNAFSILTKEGIKDGVKTLASKALAKMAAKALTWAAVKLGITVALSAIPYIGILINIAVQAVIWIAEKTIGAIKKGLDNIWQELGWGDRFRMRDLAAPVLLLGAAAVSAGTVAFSGLIFVARTAQVAAVSAAGIVIGAVVTIGLYLGFAYLVAPMLSTLVQLDSVEKVDYSSSSTTPIIPGCPSIWPVKGRYRITQGPGGKYSHYSPAYSQSVDIATPIGTPIYSTTDGVVSFAGVSAPYLNTKIIIIDSKLPSGTTFQVVYAHLSFMKVGKGQSVNVGTVIGTTGTAGSGAHLHYEYKRIRYNQCPAGALQLAENCSASQIPGAGKKCVPDAPGNFLYTN